MGLDMYLYAEKYLGGGYEYVRSAARENPESNSAREVKAFDSAISGFGLDLSKYPNANSATVSLQVAYWRKANAVHDWFVQNVQNGLDECQRADVPREKLEELLKLASEIRAGAILGEVKTKDGLFGGYEWVDEVDFTPEARELIEAELAPTSGFFFGSTELDWNYVQDLDSTIAQLGQILSDTEADPYGYDFYYQSSW